MAASGLLAYLTHNGVPYGVRQHVPAYTVTAHAAANHVSEREIVRTHIVEADGEHWMAVFPGDRLLDPENFRAALNAKQVRNLEARELLELFPDSEIDAAPPFGNLYGVRIIADSSLESVERITFKACSHAVSVTIPLPAYRRLADPRMARFTVPVRVPVMHGPSTAGLDQQARSR
jgi:Ala-tRNA(Pro) deacylase